MDQDGFYQWEVLFCWLFTFVNSHLSRILYNSGKGPVNGASPVNLMLLGVAHGNEISITSEGEQADEVLTALKSLIESNFGEG